jgi:hypothetical protein
LLAFLKIGAVYLSCKSDDPGKIVQISKLGFAAVSYWIDWLAALDDFRNWLIREAA